MKEKIIAIKRIAKSKRPLTLVTLILLFLFTVPAAIETSVATAQGLKIQSISEIEEKAKEKGVTIKDLTLAEMDRLWEEAKTADR